MKTWIKNADIVTKDDILRGAQCVIEDGLISQVGYAAGEESREAEAGSVDGEGREAGADRVIDAAGLYLLPGFVDIHCHGGNGYDFMDADEEQIGRIAGFHLMHGTTTLLATTMTGEEEETLRALDTCSAFLSGHPDSNLAGIHMEGPWLNPSQCGAQDVSYMRRPEAETLKRLKEKYPFLLRVSAAPELDEDFAFGDEGKRLGLVVSAAHTDADFAVIEEARSHGYRLMTHLYSGMKGVTRKNSYRIAGAVEAGLYFDDCIVEVIADGKHLPEELLRFIYKIKGPDRICMITDAIRAAGLPDGSTCISGSLKNGSTIIVEDGVAKLPNRQSFAGSVASTDRLYRTMARAIGSDLVSLSRMASLTPARVMGFQDRGQIARGLRADLLLVDRDLTVRQVFLGGIRQNFT